MAKNKPYRFWLYLLARAFAAAFIALPRPAAFAFARLLGRIAYAVLPHHRSRTLENLRTAFGGRKDEKEIRRIAREVFKNMAETAAEMLRFPKVDHQYTCDHVESFEAGFGPMKQAQAEGKGVIAMTAHLGNWEMLAGLLTLKGMRIHAAARRIYYEPYNRWIVSIRSAVGVKTIYREEASREFLRVLSRKEMIGLLPDQDVDSFKGIYVDFFGRPAYTTVAPVRLSMASGAPIMPIFLVRVGGRYRIIPGKRIEPVIGEGGRDEAVRKYTAEWMKQFERVIEQYPEQWVWMHNRWKTQADKTGFKEMQMAS